MKYKTYGLNRAKQIGLNGGALFQLLDWQQRFVYRSAQSIVTISNGFERVLISQRCTRRQNNTDL
jgi:hypothetical protein